MQQFLDKIKKLENNPVGLVKLHSEIANEYAQVSLKYEKLIPELAKLEKELIETYPKITESKKRFEISELGQQEKIIKIRLKSLEKLMVAIKRRIDSFDIEAKNQY